MYTSLVASPGKIFFAAEVRWTALVAVLACGFSGCTQNPYYAAPGSAAWQMSPNPAGTVTGDAKVTELNRRVQLLDDNNRQLHTQLAQSEQQAEVYKDEAELLRNQLASMSQQLESSRQLTQNAESRVRGMQASTQLRGGAVIRPNTGLSLQATQLNLPGLEVIPDQDKLRVRIPADQLFQPGTAILLPQASGVIAPVASQLLAVFPRQRMSVEAYTDNTSGFAGASATSLQLTSAQASAIVDMMTRSGLVAGQLSAVAQGSSRPLGSNETPVGRSGNRRIEIVIYPESN